MIKITCLSIFFSSTLNSVNNTCITNSLYLYNEIRYIDIANYSYNEQIIKNSGKNGHICWVCSEVSNLQSVC